ncbi:hypothetical protein [Rhodoferax sp.]|uniref:hypothetical protein n=1 Tax=Rhodoferax sp. TaxID=50421 RepID=UPI00179F004B|nr:hypothetical protein [Rhodoferax sp.]MBU3998634.1 hypothetical protein [Gammaproteobacteria bacterium]MBA3058895.1 hypothetical protein [Rhodoferax sp.]MBU4081388.1 hypothetical protein [Gammaproteobacteria bacterium]MBU4114588.1 hypothetical protein [Gammaproteobacteria bacterium]MBU4169972.1 hypothetical protein [Gammaproteobacteria bacterium]
MIDGQLFPASKLKEDMSIFSWFTNKKSTNEVSSEGGLRLVHGQGVFTPPNSHDADRKTARLERRQLLYGVVRDSMISAGVLAASYKFKVLSLDAAGRQYLVMMDLTDKVANDTALLSKIEALMVQSAKLRHDISVTAVYWRVSDHLAEASLSRESAHISQLGRQASESKAVSQSDGSAMTPQQIPRFQPLQQDEVAAFRRALASASAPAPLSESGKIVTSGRRNRAPLEEFEDTQLVDQDERASPLGVTQYGELN